MKQRDAPLLGSHGQLYLQIRVTLETDAPTTRKSAPLRRGGAVGRSPPPGDVESAGNGGSLILLVGSVILSV